MQYILAVRPFHLSIPIFRSNFPLDAVYFSGPPISSIHSDFPIQLSSSDFDTNEIIAFCSSFKNALMIAQVALKSQGMSTTRILRRVCGNTHESILIICLTKSIDTLLRPAPLNEKTSRSGLLVSARLKHSRI